LSIVDAVVRGDSREPVRGRVAFQRERKSIQQIAMQKTRRKWRRRESVTKEEQKRA
jgi:hypothetical protein